MATSGGQRKQKQTKKLQIGICYDGPIADVAGRPSAVTKAYPPLVLARDICFDASRLACGLCYDASTLKRRRKTKLIALPLRYEFLILATAQKWQKEPQGGY